MTLTIASFGLMDDEEIELDLAALALSELDHAGVDPTPHITLLKEIADRLSVVGASASSARDQAEALARVLNGEYGFIGDVDTYEAALNADMIRVLERRRGLPVSLSILYVAAARRMGWTAFALNTPGHVLIRIGEEESVIADPFNGGMIVAPDRLIALISQAMAQEGAEAQDHVAPMSNRNVLVRLLLNQASRAEREGDKERALTIYERMTLVAPDNADGWWELARLQLQSGTIDAARHSLSSVLEVTRDSAKRELVSATLDAIASR